MTTAVDTIQDTKPKKRTGRTKNTTVRLMESKKKEVVELALKNPELTIKQIGEQVGVARQTASLYLAKYGINKRDLDEFVGNRVDIVRSRQQMILENMTDEKIKAANFKDMAVAYGILLDKDRLESGQSTANTSAWVRIVTDSHSDTIEDVSK